MFRNRTIKTSFAAFFGSVYLFVALFSQNFHEHGSAEVYKDFHFKKSEKTFSKNSIAESFTDCLSCHILHTGNALVSVPYQLGFTKTDIFAAEIFAYQQRFSSLKFYVVPLRGPPANFI